MNLVIVIRIFGCFKELIFILVIEMGGILLKVFDSLFGVVFCFIEVFSFVGNRLLLGIIWVGLEWLRLIVFVYLLRGV